MEYRPKILIVDDREENLYALENVLRGVDAEIIKAGNGNDALIATLNHNFALVILDVQMPGMDGYELAELMRDEEETRYVPIVFLSAVFSDDFHVFKGYGSGAVDFITKPFNPKVLLAKIRIFLELNLQKIALEKHERELLNANALMRSVMESPSDIAIFALDREYCYINFNQKHKKSMKTRWGMDIEIGMSQFDVIKDPEVRERVRHNFDRTMRGDCFVLVEMQIGEHSQRLYKENHYNPIVTEQGTVIGLTVFLTDITKRKQIEDDLKQSNEQLQKEIEERKKAGEALRESRERAENARKTAEDANNSLTASIRYAQMIQSSLLPNPENIRSFLPESFFIWMPRDIVGGDFIFTDCFEDGFILAVIDCTGHGVPGAFMTLIACFGLKKIIDSEGFHDPAQILKRLNFLVKTTLQQDTEYALSDDGLDAAICFIPHFSHGEERSLTFASAKFPLFCARNREICVVKGDRQSIGYKRSDLNFNFTNQKISVEEGMSFYILSDGFTDQLGGEKTRRFGTRRFKELIMENSARSFEEQKEILLNTFNEYKGENEMRDDVTVVGFGF